MPWTPGSVTCAHCLPLWLEPSVLPVTPGRVPAASTLAFTRFKISRREQPLHLCPGPACPGLLRGAPAGEPTVRPRPLPGDPDCALPGVGPRALGPSEVVLPSASPGPAETPTDGEGPLGGGGWDWDRNAWISYFRRVRCRVHAEAREEEV